MGYTLLQIGQILAKADKTMYKIGNVAYDDMFSELDEKLDYERDIIYIYKKAVEYADDYYVGTVKLDTVVEKLASKVAIYDYGSTNPIYSDAVVSTSVLQYGAVLNDLADVTITNLQDNQILKYNAALGQWVNTGTNAAIRSTQSFTATLNQTVFTTTSPFQPAFLDVFLNGVRLNSSSYTTFGEYQITLIDGCLADDILDVIIYDPVTDILDLAGYVRNTRTLTINGVTQDLSANRTWTVGTGDMLKSVYDIDDDGIVDDSEKITIIARNSTGATIHKGKIVYLQGSTGNRPNMLLAQANSEATSSKTFGVVVEDVANNSDGQVAAIGTLHDLDTRSNATNPFTTDTLVDGDFLWLSATNPGYVTRTVPTQPNHAVFVGIVARTTPNQGRIVYKIQNGYELHELHNVLITSVSDKNTIYYDSATSLWKNASVSSIIGYTPGTVSSVAVSVPTGLTITSGSPVTTSGTIAIGLQSGYSIPTTIKQSNWDDAYTWVGNFPTQTGNSGKFLTTNGSILSWADVVSGVSSFNTRTGNVTLISSDVTTALGYTPYNSTNPSGYISGITSGMVTTALGYTPVTNARTLTINGVSYDLSADRSWTIATGGTVTSVALSVPTGLVITSGSPITTSGTIAIGLQSGYAIPTTASATNWDAAYNDKINSAAVTGTTTKTLTLTQQDGGTITASWTDDNTDAVTSVFGRTGAVTAQSGDYTTTQVTEGTNLYYTDSRARQSISLTTTGNSGASTYSNITGVLNVPTYTLAGLGGISLASLSALSPLSYNNGTGAFSIQVANGTQNGYLSSTDWTTFNNKQDAITLTTTGTSGAATLVGSTLNIPQYSGTNIYNSDGTLTGNRVVSTASGYTLTFNPKTTFSPTVASGDGTIIKLNAVSQSGGTNTLVLDYIGSGTAFLNKLISYRYNGSEVGYIYSNDGTASNTLSYINGSLQATQTGTFNLVSVSGTTLQLVAPGGQMGVINSQGTGGFVLQYAGTSNLKMFSTGNFVIQNGGTFTDAGYKLDVQGTGRFTGALNTNPPTASTAFTAYNLYRGGSTTTVAYSIGITATDEVLFNTANADYIFNRTSVERLRIGNTSITSNYPFISKQTIPTGTTINYGINVTNAAGANRIVLGIDSAEEAVIGLGGSDLRIRQINSGDDFININKTTGNVVIEKNTSALTTIASAKLALNSSTSGFLPPRMTSAQRSAIGTPAVGLLVYQTDATEGLYENTSTGWRIVNAAGGGSGTVTTVSVVSANGFAGTVANATTTPAITLSTTITGLLKGNGTAISAAAAGTDYLIPADEDYSVTSQTSNYTETVTRGTKIIKCDTTGGGFTVTLPTAAGNKAVLIIKKVAGSGALTVDGAGTETIDGGLTATINKVYESITLISDNTNWQIV